MRSSIAPATFNTINKLAAGISDTLALGLVNEAVGLGLPIVAAPWPSIQLYRHPVFLRSIAALREWGVTVIIDPAHLPQAGENPAVFPWDELRTELGKLCGGGASDPVSAPMNDDDVVRLLLTSVPSASRRLRWRRALLEGVLAMDEVTIGARLRTLRRWRGKTQTELAGLAGLSPSFLSMVETGQRPA